MPRLTEEELGQISGGATAKRVTTYVVRSGDTLGEIANRFGTTVALLMDINKQITDPNRLYPGMELIVPKNS